MSAAWLRHRWTLGGAALLALALVVWFVGEILVLGGGRPLDDVGAVYPPLGLE